MEVYEKKFWRNLENLLTHEFRNRCLGISRSMEVDKGVRRNAEGTLLISLTKQTKNVIILLDDD